MRRSLLIILSHSVFAFAVCFAIAKWTVHLPPLLPEHTTKYAFFSGLIFFLRYLPAILAAGFTVAFSIQFSTDAEKAQMRFSKVMLKNFRMVTITSIILTLILTLSQEVFTPQIKRKMSGYEKAPHLLAEYTKLGQECLKNKNYSLAHRYGTQILKLKPSSSEGKELIDKSEAVLKAIKWPEPKDTAGDSSVFHVSEIENETVTSLIQKSKAAAEKENWFESHYYAQLACSGGTQKDLNIKEAQRLAAEAWNKISQTSEKEKTKDQNLFERKRKAYAALSEGDNIEAYYQFSEIASEDETWVSDPDISNFFQIAKKRVENQYFFIDETDLLDSFENFTDVYFTIKRPSGVTDVVYIRGITHIKDGGKMVQYLRGLNVVTYGKHGTFLKSVSVPYAKMFSLDVRTLDEKTKMALEIAPQTKRVPFIMLKSIDRNFRTEQISPTYEFAAYVREEMRDESSFLILGISTEDFNTACNLSANMNEMNLVSLMDSYKVADSLGYSKEVAGASLVKRVTYPLLMMIIFIMLATLSWNFKLTKNQIFKFIWVLALPILTFVCDILIQLILTFAEFFYYLLTALFGNATILITIAAGTAILIVLAVHFACKKIA